MTAFGPPDRDRPGAAVAAAVLAVQAAALYLIGALLVIALVATGGAPERGADRAWLLGFLLAGCALSAALLFGSWNLAVGASRRLLLGTTVTETALLLATGMALLVSWPTAQELPTISGLDDPSRALAIATAVAYVLLLAVLGLRLRLVAASSVGRWLRAERAAREPGAEAAGPGPQLAPVPGHGVGTVLAALLPVLAVGIAATVVVLTASPTGSTSAWDGPDLQPAAENGYRGDSDFGRTLYAGGQPVAPPKAGDPLYAAAGDPNAQRCFAGETASCDVLFVMAPVGGLYEWYGSSCAGRLDHESHGGCVDELGPTAP